MTKKIKLLQSILRATLVFSVAATSLAQSTKGTIRGAVLDPSGALISRAQVTVSNTSGFTRTIKSDPTGSFEMRNMAPGIYSISIDATGFTPSLQGGIQVASGKVTRENIKLGISVNQVIEVFANDGGSPSKQAMNSL
jgi:invasion protein IalB